MLQLYRVYRTAVMICRDSSREVCIAYCFIVYTTVERECIRIHRIFSIDTSSYVYSIEIGAIVLYRRHVQLYDAYVPSRIGVAYRLPLQYAAFRYMCRPIRRYDADLYVYRHITARRTQKRHASRTGSARTPGAHAPTIIHA